MGYNRDAMWGTYDGRWIKIRDLTDIHLANIIRHLRVYQTNNQVLQNMVLEAWSRGLDREFLDKAPMPYMDQSGVWMVWSDKDNMPVRMDEVKS